MSSKPKMFTMDKWIEPRMLTMDKWIEFEHQQEKACIPLRKPVLVSQQWNLTIVHPLPVVHQHCKDIRF